jgi:PAS domain S-box-containing protein
MNDSSKTKSQLIGEIEQLRLHIAQLEMEFSNASSFDQSISQLILDTSPAFFVVIDGHGKTKKMNKSMLAALKYSEEEIREKDYLATFVPARERQQLTKLFEEKLLQGEAIQNRNHVITKDGREIFVEWQGQSLLDPNHHLKVFCGVGWDITERVKFEEEQLRIIQDENKRREELEKLREISTNMRQAEGSGDLLQVFTKEIQAFCQSDISASILFKVPQKSVVFIEPGAKLVLSREQSDAILAALQNVKNGELNARVPGFQSVLLLPLQSMDMVHGAVFIASRAPGKFTRDEHDMLNAIADMAGTALQRIDILETLEERVQQRTHDLVVLYNLITIISENWRLQDLLELSLVLTLETVKADRGIIYLVDGKDVPGLKPVIQRGFADGFLIDHGRLPDDAMARKVLSFHKPLVLDDLADHPGYSNIVGLNSYAGIPIMVRGDMRGVFSLFATDKGVFGADKMALLASIADHLGIGIENSILWEQSRENAALEERYRLARNLHDSVSQLLYSLTLMAWTTGKMLENGPDLNAVKKSVARLGDTAYQALKEMRLLLYELRPATLDSEGLLSALQHRIGTVEERLGVKVQLEAKELPELPSDLEDALYHIALEALNNIVKHAKSTNASINLAREKGYILMEINDDGNGFDPNQPPKGQGLRNMRERIQMLGGELLVDSQPGTGTHITVRIKLPTGSLEIS